MKTRWLNLLALIFVITMNGLANALPLNGLNTGQISDRFEVFFVPAGYVFSIWGLIYLSLCAFVAYAWTHADDTYVEKISGWFQLSCLANASWIVLWHYLYFAGSLAMMLVLLRTLIIIFERLQPDRATGARRWLLHAPFSMYLGWICVATIANATSVLDFYAWSGFGLADETWAVIMLAVTGLLSLIMAIRRPDPVYLGVIVWAAVGIALKHAGHPSVAPAAWALAVWAAGLGGWSVFRGKAMRVSGGLGLSA